MPSAGLSLERKFSSAMAAVSSTICDSVKWPRSRANSSSSTFSPVMVMRSAYSNASRSIGENSALVRHSGTCRIVSSVAPARIPLDALMSIQNGQPLMSATRR
jgi:hypothetical protein